MENGAKGCEVIVSGKLRAQRAKSMKFKNGYMVKSGQAAQDYVTKAVRHVMMKQGVLGIKVSIMLPQDPQGKKGPSKPLSDHVQVLDPKPDIPPRIVRAPAPIVPTAPVPQQEQPMQMQYQQQMPPQM